MAKEGRSQIWGKDGYGEVKRFVEEGLQHSINGVVVSSPRGPWLRPMPCTASCSSCPRFSPVSD